MPPTLARAATSATVRPVRIATCSRPGRATATPASRRSARRAPGSITRGRRIAGPGGQGAVEIRDDQEGRRGRREPVDRGGDLRREERPRSRRAPATVPRCGARPAPGAGARSTPRRLARAGRRPRCHRAIALVPAADLRHDECRRRVADAESAADARPRPRRSRRGRGGGRTPTASATAARLGDAVGEAAADGLALGTAMAAVDRPAASVPAPRNRSSPDDEHGDSDAGQEAGDDRETRPHGRERTSTSGPRRPSDGRCYDAGPMSDLAERVARSIRSRPPDGPRRHAAGRGPAELHHAGHGRVAADGEPGAECRGHRRRRASRCRRSDRSARRRVPAPPPTASPRGSGSRPSRSTCRCSSRGGPHDYPLCDVAQYFKADALGQPGQGRATYLYAHAREGMFLPLLTESKVKNGKKMLGMVVEVWTSDDQRFLYMITKVLRHVPYAGALDAPFNATTEQLWLQTSEGSGKTVPEAPGRRRAALAGGRGPSSRPIRRTPRSIAPRRGGPARSSRSGAGHSGDARGDGDRHAVITQKPAASPPPSAVPGLAHAEDAGDRADPGEDDGHAGQALHDHRQVVVDRRQVDVERRGRELAVVVELVGQADDVVVDVAEVDDLVLGR